MTVAEATVTAEPETSDEVRPARVRRIFIRVFGWVAAFVAPAAFHLIYGIHDVGLVEEWGIEQLYSITDSVIFWTPSAPTGSGLASQKIRPLTVVPHSVAYLLDSDSFTGYHLLNALALGLKGVAMLALLLQLRIRRSLAIGGAFLFALFPAWTGLFTFRMLHAEFAVAALVFAIAQMVAYSRAPSIWRGVAMCVAVGASLMLYEVGYVAVLVAPALLLVVSRFSWRQFLHRAALWYSVPFLNAVRVLLVWHSGERQYEQNIVTTDARRPLHELGDLLSLVYKRGLLWMLDGPMGMGITFTAVIMVIAVAAAIISARHDQDADDETSAVEPLSDEEVHEEVDGRVDKRSEEPRAAGSGGRRSLALCLGALAAAPMVALIYAPSPGLLTDPFRVFSIVSLPLTLAVVAALDYVARRTEIAACAVAIVLVALCASAATAQRDYWHNYSQFQEHTLGAVMAASVGAPAARTLVVVDPERLISGPAGIDIYRLIPELVTAAVNFARPSIYLTLVCHQSPEQLPVEVPSLGECGLKDGMVTNNAGSVPLETSAVIEIRATQTPRWPAVATRLPTHRERALLHCVASQSCSEGKNGIEARLLPIGAGA